MRRLTAAFVVALSLIALTSGTVHFVLDRIVTRHTDSAIVIGTAGRNGALVQRIAHLSLEHALLGRPDSRSDLDASLVELDRLAMALTRGDADLGLATGLSPQLQAIYFESPDSLERRLQQFLEAGRQLSAGAPGSGLSPPLRLVLDAANGSLAADLDQVTARLVSEANGRIQDLHQVQRGVFLILLTTLLLEAAFIFRPLVLKVSEFARRLIDAATRDPLSGVLNRRALLEVLQHEMARSARSGRPVSILMADIDRFKSINDTHGHAVGDKVIGAFGRLAVESVRACDAVGRTGGEEFALILPETSGAGALLVAERLRIAFAALTFPPTSVQATISIGVAEASVATERAEDVLARADAALYVAKRSGRDRVALAEEARTVEVVATEPSAQTLPAL